MNSHIQLRLIKVAAENAKDDKMYVAMGSGNIGGGFSRYTLQYRVSETWYDVPVEGDESGIDTR